MEGSNIPLSLSSRKVGRYIIVPSLSRLIEYDTSLRLIGFPTSSGLCQQIHTLEKPH